MDKKIKSNGHGTLDQRVASCLASDIVHKAELIALVEEAEQAIAVAQATIETESANALDISNPDPDASDLQVRRATRTVARLDQALPKLRDRIRSIERVEYTERWHTDADVVESERDRLATELRQLYPFIVERLADLYERIDANSEAIGRLHMSAPRGENRRLLDAELVARNLPSYDAAHPRIRDNLKLPDWDISREQAYPPSPTVWNERARAMADAMAKRMAEKFELTHGPQWAEGRELAIAEEEAGAAKAAEELKAQEAESFDGYLKRQREAELCGRGIASGGG